MMAQAAATVVSCWIVTSGPVITSATRIDTLPSPGSVPRRTVARAARSGRLVLARRVRDGTHEHHRHGGLREDALGDAAQQDPADGAAPRGAHHDQIGAERLGLLQDPGHRIAEA